MTAGIEAGANADQQPTELTVDRLSARRAIEALRCGVPSRDAVAALGSGQPEIEDRFDAVLDSVGLTKRGAARGLLLGAGFGAGKSHVLEQLTHLALQRDLVVSRVVISKETPLHDPVKLFRAAVESATLPDGSQGAVVEAAGGLDPGSPTYTELLHRASGPAMSARFPVTLSLLPYAQENDGDFAESIVNFWSGDPIGVADLRRTAKLAAMPRPDLSTVPVKELARQRFRFLSHLFVAAGYQGWVLLLDEVELIGRYTPLQRGRSYAELAGWLRADAEDPGCPLATVLAMTDDFDAAVLTEKGDREQIPVRLRAKESSDWAVIATDAEAGMRLVAESMLLLERPDAAELEQTYAVLKSLHGAAFGWDPPDVPGLERLGATRMRQYVRAWINEWDLVRLDAGYRPESESVELQPGYAETTELD